MLYVCYPDLVTLCRVGRRTGVMRTFDAAYTMCIAECRSLTSSCTTLSTVRTASFPGSPQNSFRHTGALELHKRVPFGQRLQSLSAGGGRAQGPYRWLCQYVCHDGEQLQSLLNRRKGLVETQDMPHAVNGLRITANGQSVPAASSVPAPWQPTQARPCRSAGKGIASSRSSTFGTSDFGITSL